MNRTSQSFAIFCLIPVSLLLCLAVTGCTHNSNGSIVESSMDCSDAAIAKSDHPFQRQADCAVAKDARMREFRKDHDCNTEVVLKQPNPDEYQANCNGEAWDGKPSKLLQHYRDQKARQEAWEKEEAQKEAAARVRQAAARRKLEDSCIPEMVKARVTVPTYRRCEPENAGRVLFNLDTDVVSNDRQQKWIKIAESRRAGGE